MPSRKAARAILPVAGLGLAALFLFLAFRAGGFFPAQHALVALVFVVALILRMTVAEQPLAGHTRNRKLLVSGLALLSGRPDPRQRSLTTHHQRGRKSHE